MGSIPAGGAEPSVGWQEASDVVWGNTPPDRGCRFKRRWFDKYTCRRCGYPVGWHHQVD